jgi:protease IV
MRDFLKQTLATLVALCIFGGLSFGGLILLLVGLAASGSKDAAPKVSNKSVLTINMSQPITDAPAEIDLRDILNGGAGPGGITLRTAVKAIEAAAQDKRIVGIYLFNRNSAAGSATSYANLKELREALARFKQSGKKIYAYDLDWQEKEYYLASIADQIAINPMGSLEMNGLSSETTFYGAAFQKFGVGVQAIWRGKYKSAIEPWTRKDRSQPSREQTAKLLGDIWQEFLQTTSAARKLKPEDVDKISDTKGMLTPEEGKNAKLFDRIAHTDEIIDELKQIAGEDKETKSFRQIALRKYADAVDSRINSTKGEKIAVVYAEGSIVNGQGEAGQIGGDRLSRELRKIRQDKDVKAVVLRVNSPGGSATASDLIQRELILIGKDKPVVVSMGGVAASGGYWISTYANKIFAEPNTITGSIGVYGLQPNFQKLANENGITWDVVKTGKFADSMTVSRPKNKEEIAIIQRIIGDIYDQFLTKVATSRKLDRAKVEEIAQGRVWSGTEAKKIGLVDELGGLEQAIASAADLAKLGDRWHVEEFPRSRSFEEQFFQGLFGSHLQSFFKETEAPSDPFTGELQKLKQDFQSLKALNDPRGIYMRMPENLRID